MPESNVPKETRRIRTRADFELWLKEQPATTRFIRVEELECPLGQYCGGTVTSNWYRLPGETERRPMPHWASEFVTKFDNSGKIDTAIGPRTALKLLRSIP